MYFDETLVYYMVCWVCAEIKERNNPLSFINSENPGYKYRKGRVILETNNFIVYPAIGSFVENYIIITPKMHFTTFADMVSKDQDREKLTELERIRLILVDIMLNKFGYNSVLVFEHGEKTKSVEHAHLNILPIDDACKEVLKKKLDEKLHILRKRFTSFIEALMYVNNNLEHSKNYVIIGFCSSNKAEYYVFVEGEEPESQLIRKILCEYCKIYNCKGEWDWHKYPFKENIEKTYENFYRILNVLKRKANDILEYLKEYMNVNIIQIQTHVHGVDTAINWGIAILSILVIGLTQVLFYRNDIILEVNVTSQGIIILTKRSLFTLILFLGYILMLQVIFRGFIHFSLANALKRVRNACNNALISRNIVDIYIALMVIKYGEIRWRFSSSARRLVTNFLFNGFATPLIVITLSFVFSVIYIEENVYSKVFWIILFVTYTLLSVYFLGYRSWFKKRFKETPRLCKDMYRLL